MIIIPSLRLFLNCGEWKMGRGSGERQKGLRPQHIFSSFLLSKPFFCLCSCAVLEYFYCSKKKWKAEVILALVGNWFYTFLWETVRREALRANSNTAIIYTLAFWFILAVSQPKYMNSNTHDQNTGSFRNQGEKNLYCYGPVAVHYSFVLINWYN